MPLFAQLLIESRVDDFKKLLKGIYNDEFIQDLVNKDTSKNHKNLLWIGKILKNDKDLDIDDLYKNLELFNKVGTETDLYKFRDYMQFLDFLSKKSKEVSMGKMQQIKQSSTVIGNTKRWLVVVPESHEASKYFGGGTKWCISTSNQHHWQEYYHKNTIVMIKDRTKNPTDPFFKVAIVGNMENSVGYGRYDDKLDKIKELDRLATFYNTQDHTLSSSEVIDYLSELPDDLIEDILYTVDSDNVSEREYEKHIKDAEERFDDGGKEELVSDLFKGSIDFLNVEGRDIDEDYFYSEMQRKFKEEIDDGNFDEFLREIWHELLSHYGIDSDGGFNTYLDKRNLERIVNGTSYSFDTYKDLAKEVLTASSKLKEMDQIIKDSLKKYPGVLDPYNTLVRTYDSVIPDTNYYDTLDKSLRIYNAKYYPGPLQGQPSFPQHSDFFTVGNEFMPKTIDDVIKVLNINPKANEMIDWIQKYRKDLRESKKKTSKYRKFFV